MGDTKTLHSASYQEIKVWTRDGSGSYAEQQTLSGHSSTVNALAYDQDTKTLYSGSYDMTVKVWTRDGSGGYHAGASQTLSGHSAPVVALALDQDTKTLFSGS